MFLTAIRENTPINTNIYGDSKFGKGYTTELRLETA